MPFTYFRRAAVALALLAVSAGCTVKSTDAPPLTGPSGLALSLTLSAIPDSISQDGGSQSSVKVLAIGPDGKPLSGVPLRLDMSVGGVVQDFGTLSARSVVTNSDGVATAVFTAPASSAGGVACSTSAGNCVAIVATPTSTNFAASNPEQVMIRLVPTGVILPPAGAPTASFAVSPQPVQMNVAATFDASASKPGTGASAISSYAWSFGDGTTSLGRTVNHTFTSQQSFNVTLTVTNDRGVTATATNVVAVGSVSAPSPNFVFSPTAPQIGQAIVFNADTSTAAAGHSLTTFAWDFGDGSTASGSTTTHAYSNAGTYNVVLSVTDDTGQRVVKASSVAVSSSGGGGGGATVASFIFSPTAPVVGQVVFFNASGSTAQTGHTLTKYAWDFGDGTLFTASTPTTSHTFATAGAYSVILVATDDTGQTAKTTNSVTVAGAGASAPTAKFFFSPTAPVVSQQVVFDGSTSTAATGLTLTDYSWVFGDGTPAIHTTSKTIAHSYAFVGTFNVSLTVTDNTGVTNSVNNSVPVTAGGAPPTANFTFSPSVGVAGQNVTFTDTSTAGGSAITSRTWNFGDGSPLDNTSGSPVNHAFARAGTYSITLTVTDANGRTSTVSKSIVVQ